MADYDFKALSHVEFEQISRDLLRNKLNIDFESFKSGADQGVDLRHAVNKRSNIIVQCKHYANSSFSSLKSELKKEKEKVDKLKPKPTRYILVTSLGLTPKNKEEIKLLLSPYIKYTKDIVTRDTLNGWLVDYPYIERSYLKLWATTGVALNRIIKSRIFNYSEAQVDELETKLRYFVKNKSFDEALEIINEQRFCIIAGIPGIGKTTLAEMLLVYFIREEYEPIVITSDIEDAFDVYDKEAKRIYYYDDFLGQTGLEKKLNKNEDSRIVDFCKLCRKSKTSFFVLTTREYILNQAKATYEKLEKSGIDKNKCVIDLKSYSDLDKGMVLYNHIYHRSLPQKFKNAILKNNSYLEIILHKSFNPRVVEWMVDPEIISDLDKDDYVNSFIYKLDNPSDIWSHAFNNQISDCAKHLIICLLTCSRYAFLKDCQCLFNNLRNYIAKKYNVSRKHNEFNYALKEVEGNFITVSLVSDEQVIHFHNPSVIDYVSFFLHENVEIISDVINSSQNIDQLMNLWNAFSGFKNNPIIEQDIKELFLNSLARTYGTDSINLTRYYTISGETKFTHSSNCIERQISNALDSELLPFTEVFINKTKEVVEEYFSNIDNNYIWHRVNILLKSLNKYKNELNIDIDSYLKQTVSLLKNNLTQIDDYDQLANICDISKVTDNVIVNDLTYIENQLKESIEDEIEYYTIDNDLSMLQDCLDSLEKLKRKFRFELSEQIELVEDAINSAEDPQDYLDDYASEKDSSNRDSSASHVPEIIDIFNTLK